MAEEKDKTIPSVGNPKLQPTLGVGQSDTYELGGGKTTSYLGSGPTSSSLVSEKGAKLLESKGGMGDMSTWNSLTSSTGSKLLQSKGGMGDLSTWGNAGKDGPITSHRKDEHNPYGNAGRDAPKSKIGSSVEKNSSFGRGVPFGGTLWPSPAIKRPNGKMQKLMDMAIGGYDVSIPSVMSSLPFNVGAGMAKPLAFHGGIPESMQSTQSMDIHTAEAEDE